jgi:hypothetical protein
MYSLILSGVISGGLADGFLPVEVPDLVGVGGAGVAGVVVAFGFLTGVSGLVATGVLADTSGLNTFAVISSVFLFLYYLLSQVCPYMRCNDGGTKKNVQTNIGLHV